MAPHLFTSILLALFLAAGETAAAQQVIVTMTPESVDEAIRLAADEKATARFLDAYVLQTRAGWGNGPLIGEFSTPFARVVQAAVAARKRGDPFTPADVTPALIAPELHVIAAAQTAATDEGIAATVLSVVLARRGSKDPADVIQPLRTTELAAQSQDLGGTAFKGPGIVAVFPLSALVVDSEIRVLFDRTARGFSGLSMCRECTVPVTLNKIR
jgi:hypothetical protein